MCCSISPDTRRAVVGRCARPAAQTRAYSTTVVRSDGSTYWPRRRSASMYARKLVEVSGYRPDEIAYVGDRLDNDIAPAAAAGLFTVWIRPGPRDLSCSQVTRRRRPDLTGA